MSRDKPFGLVLRNTAIMSCSVALVTHVRFATLLFYLGTTFGWPSHVLPAKHRKCPSQSCIAS